MKFYLAIGDYWDDGHGKYRKHLISAPSMEQVKESHKKIKETYGKKFFEGFATDYCNSGISFDVFNTLKGRGFPFKEQHSSEYHYEYSWDEFDQYPSSGDYGYFFRDENPINDHYADFESLNDHMIFVLYVFLLNQFGAEITMEKDYPTLQPEDIVGYGCFQ